MSTNKRVTLSVAQKQELCQKKIDNPSIPNIELARQYNVKPNMVSDILKRKSEYLSVSSSELERKRFRQPMYKEIDDAVGIWMSQFLAANQTLRGDILQKKAKQFADRFGFAEFTASAGWLSNFKKRNNVQSYIKSGEAASGPSLEEIDEYRRKVTEKLSEYALEDIYNCDETALFWQLEPSKTLAQGPVTGTKKSKNRVTILLTCNATGEDKLKPLFIHKYKNPRPLRGMSVEDSAKYRKLLVENRVEEYDISQELNTPIAPVNIRNAIDFVVEAWNQVDLLTIKNCWENDENNLNDAIQKLPYDDTLSGLEYINVDKLGEDEILLEDDEIVETVRSRHNAETVQDDDENEFIPNISLSDVLSSVEKLITFHNFPPENYEVTSDELKILKGIRRKVLRFKSEFMLQLNLDEYVICE
ncbi:Pdc2p [Rhizophagus irregularis DAOM 197198w]|uniref:Pdc2p n=1 Tax=Rhizophagus irregularis (strain DAOM 197198w) TaxID=1432141 RepID=A0A015MVE8_RHIIW|nr:Pdc2p [Rhizophagus irregularis DAOM 197198w]